VSAGINKHRSIVDDRVTILANAIFLRNFVVGNARFGKLSADPYITVIAVRWPMFFDNITMEARALIYAQNAWHAADNSPDRAANNGSYRTGGPLAFAGTSFNASGHTLGWGWKRRDYSCGKKCRSDKPTDHLEAPIWLGTTTTAPRLISSPPNSPPNSDQLEIENPRLEDVSPTSVD
jgi:hypothetical protein